MQITLQHAFERSFLDMVKMVKARQLTLGIY